MNTIIIICPDKSRQEALKKEFGHEMSTQGNVVTFLTDDLNLFSLRMFHVGISYGISESHKVINSI